MGKPNILFIVTDHQAFHGHDRPGEFDYKPPHFEAFCEEGVRFDRAYSVCPLCTPARASMMTGLYPSKHRLLRNTDYERRHDFSQGQRLYGHYLKDAGYRNAYIGKWHCGKDKVPVDFGIEGWSLPDYGQPYTSDAYKIYAKERGFGDARARIEHHLERPEWDGQTHTLDAPLPWTHMNASGVLEGPPEAHEEQFVAHLTIEKMKELARGDEPWSLVASFWGPHHPFFPSEPYASMVDPKSIPEYPTYQDNLDGRPLRHILHREIHHRSSYAWPDWTIWQQILARAYGQGYQTDAAIGQVLAALDEQGLAENTLVIWCADHGDTVASHGGLWDKSSTYTEEVARVPMAIRWPRAFKGGVRTDKVVSNMDVTATMLEAAGVEVPEAMDSRGMLALCRDPRNAPWPEDTFCEHHGHGGDNIFQRMLINQRYKYNAALYDGDELYDLQEDPYERHNLIDSAGHKDVRDAMRQRIIEHLDVPETPVYTEIAFAERRLAIALAHGR